VVSYRWSGTSTKTTSQILWIRVTTLENLKVVFLNADQFTNKKDDIAGNEPDIILISEVLKFRMYQFHWLLSIPNYQACFNFDPNSNIAPNNMHELLFMFIVEYLAPLHLHLTVILRSIYG